MSLRKLVKWTYLLCALLLIALAVLVQSGRSFSHLLGDYDQDIARYLSQKLHAQVNIGRIDAAWDSLKPSLDIRDVRIHNTAGEPIVSLARARVRLDILGSLRNRNWVWSSIQLGDTQLSFRQLDNGKWQLSGLQPAAAPAADAPSAVAHTRLDRLIDMLLLSRHIEFQGTQLQFVFHDGEALALHASRLLLENSGNFHRLSLDLDVGDQSRSVALVLEGQGDPRKPQKFRSSGHLQLNNFPTSEPVSAVAAFLLGGAAAPLRSEGWINANLWLNSSAGGKGFDVIGDVGLERLWLPLAEREVRLDGVNSQVLGQWNYTGDWQLQLRELGAVFKQQALPPGNLAFSYSAAAHLIQVRADKLELAPLAALLEEAGTLGQGRIQDVLAHLAPRGHLLNARLQLPLRNPGDWQLAAHASEVNVGAWHGVPALTGVNGYVQANQKGGFVNLDSHTGFSMHFANTYAEPMVYDSARGQVAWHLDKAANKIRVNSGQLQLTRGSESLAGYFWLHLPWQRNTGDIDLYLQVGGQNLNATRYRTYLPQQVPLSLRNWLDAAVGETNPGIARSAGFIFRGTLNNPNPMARSLDLYLDIAAANLRFSPEWPALEQLQGKLLVHNNQVQAWVDSAQLLGAQVGQTQVQLNPLGKGQLLTIDGHLLGSAMDGVRLLREGGLRRQLGNGLDSWRMTGSLAADINLAIPLGQAPTASAKQQVSVELDAPEFEVQNLQLNFSDLQGHIEYSDSEGLSSNALRAKLFGEPVSAQLDTLTAEGGYKQTLIELTGLAPASTLAIWSKRPELLFLSGDIPYHTRVELNHRSRAQLEASLAALPASAGARARAAASAFAHVAVHSDLSGVAVNLPNGLGKAADKQRPLAVDLWLHELEMLVDISYNRPEATTGKRARSKDWIDSLFLLERGQELRLANASIALGQAAELEALPAFKVQGYLEDFQLELGKQWLARYEEHQAQLAQVTGQPSSQTRDTPGRIAGLPLQAELLLGRYQLGALSLNDLQVSATRDWLGWHLKLNNQTLAGSLMIPNASIRPLQVKLDYLRLTREQLGLPEVSVNENGIEEGAAEDVVAKTEAMAAITQPLRAQLDPRDLPRANIVIGQLSLMDEDYGNWSLELHPKTQGVVIERIQGQVRGLRIEGAHTPEEGAKMLWLQGEMGPQTRVIGALRAGNIGDVMRQWGKPGMLESQSAYFNLDLYWAGSPQDFALNELEGTMSLALNKGRFIRNATSGALASEDLLRLLSVVNFDSLARRMRLDFSDLYQSGLAYDEMRGLLGFGRGTLTFVEPLEVIGPSSRLQMAGSIDLKRERLRTRMVATLPVAGNLTFLAALVTGLPAAVGIYVVSKLFKKQVDQATSISYRITGSWDKPKMRFDRLFESDDSLRSSVKPTKSSLPRPEENLASAE